MLITFRFRYPISRTMAFEREYHPNLRLTLPEKRHLLKNAITIWMFDHGKLIGETYGFPLDGRDEIPVGCPRDPRSIYCYSNTILENTSTKATAAFSKPPSSAASLGTSIASTATPAPAPARLSTNPSAPASAPAARTGTAPAKTTASTSSPSAIPRSRSAGFQPASSISL